MPLPPGPLTGGALLDGLRLGNDHRGGLRCLAVLPVAAPVLTRLREEVDALCARHPASAPSDRTHVTNWVGPQGDVRTWSLLNRTGRTDDFSADHDLSCEGKWYVHRHDAPRLGSLLDAFPDLVNCRVNLLGSGASLPAHEEHVPFKARSGTIGARIRLHPPGAGKRRR